MSILSRTGTENEFVLTRGSGTESVMMLVNTYTEDNPPVSRANHNEGDYSFLFGERSYIYSGASGSGAFGGLINIHGENSYGFGYRVYVFQNQNLAGGYVIGSNAKESMIWGNTIGVDCTEVKYSGVVKSYIKNDTESNKLSKYLMIFGDNHTVGYECKSDLIVGSYHSVGNGYKWSLLSGAYHTIADGNECVNAIGYENSTFGLVTDSTMIGYYNNICNTDSQTALKYIFLFGDSNKNFTGADEYSPGTCYGNIYLFGTGLYPTRHHQHVIGTFNKGISDSIFEIGCGTGSSSSNRASNFAITSSHSLIVGLMKNSDGHNITRTLEDSIITGYLNKIHKYSVGCIVSGSYNRIGPNSGSYTGEVGKCGIIGQHNVIDDVSQPNATWDNIMLFGRYLKNTRIQDQIVVGSYNAADSLDTNAIFIVGTGENTSSRRSSFRVGYDPIDGHFIYIGNTRITETQLQALLS